MEIRDILSKFAEEKGIIAGICNAERLDEVEDHIKASKTPFVSKDIEKRLDPKAILPSVKSIIVIGVNYSKKYDFEIDSIPRGQISIYAAQRDYHKVLKEILEELALKIKKETGNFENKILVDSGYLVEKELARKAGLGFYGENQTVISERFGSMFFIGCLLTDIEVVKSGLSVPMDGNCGGCEKCVEACPSSALSRSNFDYRRCISYITQKKGELSSEEKKLMGNCLYGCDICQMVCPHNDDKPFELISDIELVMPKLAEIKDISDAEFKKRYGDTAIGWIGAETLRRNAVAVENNRNGKYSTH